MSSLSLARILCTLALIFAAARFTQSLGKAEFKKLMNETVDECRTQLEIEGNLTELFLNSKHNNLKCELMKCMDLKLLGPFETLDERLEKSSTLIEEVYGEDDDLKNKILKIYHKCTAKHGSDDCDTMLKISRCCMTETKELKDEIKKYFKIVE